MLIMRTNILLKTHKNYLLILLVNLFFLLGYSQEINRDSLWTVWNNVKQSNIVRANAIITIMGNTLKDTDSMLYFSELAYDFAKTNGLKKQMAIALEYKGVYFFTNKDYNAAKLNFEKSLILYDELGTKEKESALNILVLIARTSYIQNDYEEAIKNCKSALDISKELNDKTTILQCLNNLGVIYVAQGNNFKASEYYFLSLKIAEELGVKKDIALSYNNIGATYSRQGDVDKALEYYLLALGIRNEIGDNIVSTSVNIGDIYLRKKDYNKALEYLFSALKSARKSQMPHALSTIGDVYLQMGDYTEALDYLNRSLSISEEIDNKKLISRSFYLLGSVYLKQRNYAKAIENAKKSLHISQEIDFLQGSVEASFILYTAKKNEGRYKNALEMYELYTKMKDSIKNEKNQRELINQEYKYEYGKIKLADSIAFVQQQKIDKLAFEVKLGKEKNLQYILYGGISFLLIIGGVLYFNFLRKKKMNLILKKSSNELKELNYKLKFFTSVVAHDLRSPIISFKALTEKLIEEYKNVVTDKDLYLLNLASQKMSNLSNMIKELLLFYSLEDKEIKLEETQIHLESLLDTIKSELETTYNKKISLNINNEIKKLVVNKNLIYQLFTNLISNSVKYAKPDTPLEISIKAKKITESTYEFCVSDNGVGIPDSFKAIAFDLFTRVNISNKLSHGLGLPICKNIVNYYNGKIWAEDNPNSGASVYFKLQSNRA